MIDALCLEKFYSLPARCRPVSNNEAMILAGIVMENVTSKQFEVVCLASGVKCQPLNKISKSGDTLHDSHAEVIARRALMVYLYKQLDLVRLGENSILESYNGKYRVKLHVKFHMYISQAPCGDASIVQLASSVEGIKPYSVATEGILKGRLHFSELNRLRTKPGRADSPESSSMSCRFILCFEY
jgi:tRNA-specific adenosine deaminase 1